MSDFGRRQTLPGPPQDNRPYRPRFAPISLLAIGLIMGLAGGLYYAWLINPVVFVEAGPARLRESDKAAYIILVSQSYAVDGDWPRAQRRLAALDEADIADRVVALLETSIRQQQPANVIRNLAVMAQELGAQGPAVALFAPATDAAAGLPPTPTLAVSQPAAATATATIPLTATPRPTLLPAPTQPTTPTPQPVFRLLTQEMVCDEEEPAPRLEVVTLDALLDPLPGVEVNVTWASGSDSFFTGFQPEQGPGYGDFTMSADLSYSVSLAEGSPEISGLRLEACESGFAGGWRLTFQNLRRVAPPAPSPEALP